jgi:H+-translocating NAD(P) transhydrogenase subunit alpha
MNRTSLKSTTLNRLGFLLIALALSGSLYAADAGSSGLSPIDGFAALFIFMLAAFTGHEIIGKVPVILHTPLMSGSNFVHGIVLVGAMVALGHADSLFGKILGFIGVLLGAGNAAGGYVVTERMLDMFKSSKKPGAK